MKTGLSLASKIASGTSCALFWVKMVLVRNVGHRCQANTENDLAKQLNSETGKKQNHNKW